MTFLDQISQVGPMKTGNVFVRLAKLKLFQNVVTNPLCGARSKSCDRTIRKMNPQTAQLSVFRAKFVAPFRDAVCLVDGEKRDRNTPQPRDSIRAGQPLRRQIQKPILATCAGAILVARRVSNPPQPSLDLIDIDVARNAYGRQVDSFISAVDTTLAGGPVRAAAVTAT